MSPFTQQYSDEDLLQWFRELADNLGRTPGQRDLAERGGPSVMTYYRRFGNLQEVARRAGIKARVPGYGGRVV